MLNSLNYPVMRFFDKYYCCAALKYLKDNRINYLEYYDAPSACWIFIITDSTFNIESALKVIAHFASLYRSSLGKIQLDSLYGMMVGDPDA